ncbi:MAG: class B sortase [Eubacteriales bacterium]|nr:class B sortase [Eubacteriales bacterium]
MGFYNKTTYLQFYAALLACILSGCGPADTIPSHTGTAGIPETTIQTEYIVTLNESGNSTKPKQLKATQTTKPRTEIDFAALKAINDDIYAWIEIPGTAISYPVLRADNDNAYYLKHSSDGSYSAAGAIFTEDYNSKDFNDRNTVIYGHYMEDGTLFTGLHSFMDESFFTDNRYIYIHTPEKTLNYKIFAVYPYDTRHLLLSFDYSNPYVFGKVFDSVFGIRDMNASIADDISLDSENDLILTLSTCYYGDEDQRLLLQAVLIK